MKPTCAALLLIVALAGCSTDPGARREIALLRAELVDLENQYYVLRSRADAAGVNTSDLIQGGGPAVHEVLSDPGGWDRGYRPGFFQRFRRGMTVEGSSPAYDPGYEFVSPESGTAVPGGQEDYQRPATVSPRSEPARPAPVEPEEIPPDSIRGPSAGQPDQSRAGRGRLPAQPASGQHSSPDRPAVGQSGPPTTARELLAIGEQCSVRDIDGDGQPDGIEAAFALLDADGNSTEGPARLVFSLMDNTLPPGQQRIGLWEFTTDAGKPRRGSAEHSDPFNYPQKVFLPWKNGVPSGSTLWLFIRHSGNDGDPLETSTPVTIESAPRLDSNTGPRSARSVSMVGSGARETAASGQRGEASQGQGSNSAGQAAGPEIEIDVNGLDSASRSSRPRWRPNR